MAIETLNITALRAKTTNTADIYYTTDPGKEGEWRYDSMDTTSTDNTGTILVSVNGMRFKRIIQDGVINVTWFGAKGNNNPNDAENNTVAFNKASVVLWGVGGELVIPNGIYYVGSQSNTRPASTVLPDTLFWTGKNEVRFRYGRTIIDIRDCINNSVKISGNGSVLKFAPGFYFGAWDMNGDMPMPLYSGSEHANSTLATKADIGNMISLVGNTRVEVTNLTLDGCIQNQLIGGEWGDAGYQVTNTGIFCNGNEQLLIQNVKVQNFGVDGVYLRDDAGFLVYSETRPNWQKSRVEMYDAVLTNNGRQAMSVASTGSLLAMNCKFNRSGLVGHLGWRVALCAGIDFETEVDLSIDKVELINCEFIDNKGSGVIMVPLAKDEVVFPINDFKANGCVFVASEPNALCFFGNTSNVTFTDCRFKGYVEVSAGISGSTLLLSLSAAQQQILPRFYRCYFEDAMNNPPDQSYKNSLLIAISAVLEDCTFIFNNTCNKAGIPDYLLRLFAGYMSNSTLIVRNGSGFGNGKKLAHLADSQLNGVDIVIPAANTSNGWIVEDHAQSVGTVPGTLNITINKEITRLGTRAYW